MKKQAVKRCHWVSGDALYEDYHDLEWGVPEYDHGALFEMLLLEGAQAGLSWITILKKRDNYRRAFNDFDPHKMARYSTRKRAALMQDAGIVRNRLKIEAAVGNAKAYLEVMDEDGGFSGLVWQFCDGAPIQNRWRNSNQVPVNTERSDAMSKTLKKRGFKFVGSTICYSFMQATGMVNDHTTGCFRHAQVQRLGKRQRTARR